MPLFRRTTTGGLPIQTFLVENSSSTQPPLVGTSFELRVFPEALISAHAIFQTESGADVVTFHQLGHFLDQTDAMIAFSVPKDEQPLSLRQLLPILKAVDQWETVTHPVFGS